MEGISDLIAYWRKLNDNMNHRVKLVNDGKFLCDGVCDKNLTQDDINHLNEEILSFKKKTNIVADKFNNKFNTNFRPFPSHEGKLWNSETNEFDIEE